MNQKLESLKENLPKNIQGKGCNEIPGGDLFQALGKDFFTGLSSEIKTASNFYSLIESEFLERFSNLERGG